MFDETNTYVTAMAEPENQHPKYICGSQHRIQLEGTIVDV